MRLVLDLVDPLDLLGDQLGVPHHLDLARPEFPAAREAEQQGAILGDVVGGTAEQLGPLGEDLSPGSADHARRGRRTGVAASATVDVDDQLHRRGIMPTRRDGAGSACPAA